MFPEIAHFAGAGGFVSFVLHGNVTLWFTPTLVIGKETAITALEDVDFGVVEFGILVHVDVTVAITEMKGSEM